MATWGLRWARRLIKDEDIDVASFMWDFHRTLNTKELPDGETVICVRFSDLDEFSTWWLIANDEVVDLCTVNPGKEIDLYVTGNFENMVAVWMGDTEIGSAIRAGQIKLHGAAYLTKSTARWFATSPYAEIRPEHINTDLLALHHL